MIYKAVFSTVTCPTINTCFFFFFSYNRVCDYVAAGLDHKLVDLDGGIHLRHLQAQNPQVVSPLPHTLPSDGWTSSLQQLPPFNYGCLFADLITNSETVAEDQHSVATDTYRAGAMKHKEQGYRLFRDDHVKQVRFHPGSLSDNHCIFQTEVKPSMKTTRSYSTVVALSKLTGYVIGSCCKCKAGAGGCCKHVVALLYNILDYVELGLAAIPEGKTCNDKPQQWNRLKASASNGPILFSDIQFVHHTYGKRKAEAAALRMKEHKKYRACPEPLGRILEEQVRHFCTRLESHQKTSLFATVMRANDCKPLPIEAASPPSLQVDENTPANVNTSSSHSSLVPCASLTPEEVALNRVSVTPGQAVAIEAETRGQSGCSAWYENADGG